MSKKEESCRFIRGAAAHERRNAQVLSGAFLGGRRVEGLVNPEAVNHESRKTAVDALLFARRAYQPTVQEQILTLAADAQHLRLRGAAGLAMERHHEAIRMAIESEEYELALIAIGDRVEQHRADYALSWGRMQEIHALHELIQTLRGTLELDRAERVSRLSMMVVAPLLTGQPGSHRAQVLQDVANQFLHVQLGQYERALPYANRLRDSQGVVHDRFVLMGHVQWCYLLYSVEGANAAMQEIERLATMPVEGDELVAVRNCHHAIVLFSIAVDDRNIGLGKRAVGLLDMMSASNLSLLNKNELRRLTYLAMEFTLLSGMHAKTTEYGQRFAKELKHKAAEYHWCNAVMALHSLLLGEFDAMLVYRDRLHRHPLSESSIQIVKLINEFIDAYGDAATRVLIRYREAAAALPAREIRRLDIRAAIGVLLGEKWQAQERGSISSPYIDIA